MLLGLPFAAIGIGIFIWSIGIPVKTWYGMQAWQPVEASLTAAEVKSRRVRNEDTNDYTTVYQATASYSYDYKGSTYSNTKVAINDGYSSYGGFYERLGDTLEYDFKAGRSVTAYVNPDKPSQALLNRELRLSTLWFALVAVMVFGGTGLGLLCYGLFTLPEQIPGEHDRQKPWTTRRKWASASVKSSGKLTMMFVWCFAAFWNVIAVPIGIKSIDEFMQGNNPALIALLFPLVGAGLLYWAIKEAVRWRRFGPASLQLDPYPGAIGGQVGGTIDVRLSYDRAHSFKVTLKCLQSYYTGGGNERKREEACVWQREGYAHTQPGARGTQLAISFDVKDDLPESEPVSKCYHLWRLKVEAQLPGADFARSYEIPVFATGAQASDARESSEDHQQAQQEREQLLESVLDIQKIPGGITMHYPAFSIPEGKLAGVLVGGGFATIGFFVGGEAGFLGPLFFTLGVVFGLGCLSLLMMSLNVRFDRRALITQRKLLGADIKTIKVKRSELTYLAIAESNSSLSGNQHVIYFKVQAHRRRGKPVTIGDNFAGEVVANKALESISVLTGVPRK